MFTGGRWGRLGRTTVTCCMLSSRSQLAPATKPAAPPQALPPPPRALPPTSVPRKFMSAM